MEIEKTAIQNWLESFAQAVRAQDYEAGEPHFAPDAIGFGTYADALYGRGPLVAGQWKNIWGATRGFTFDFADWRCGVCQDLAWAAITWTSQRPDENGVWQHRPGRATFAYEKREGKWLAVHSHFSLFPSYLRSDNPEHVPAQNSPQSDSPNA